MPNSPKNPDAIRFPGAQMINGSATSRADSANGCTAIGRRDPGHRRRRWHGADRADRWSSIRKGAPAFANQFDQVQQAVDDMYPFAPVR